MRIMDGHAQDSNRAAASSATLKKPGKLVQRLTSVLNKLKPSKGPDSKDASSKPGRSGLQENASPTAQQLASSAAGHASPHARHAAGSGDASPQWHPGGARAPAAGGGMSYYWHSQGSQDSHVSDWDMQGGWNSSQGNDMCLTAGSTDGLHAPNNNSKEDSRRPTENGASEAPAVKSRVESDAPDSSWPGVHDVQDFGAAQNQRAVNSTAQRSTSVGLWTAQAAGGSRVLAQPQQAQDSPAGKRTSTDQLQWPNSASNNVLKPHQQIGSNSLSQWVTTPSANLSTSPKLAQNVDQGGSEGHPDAAGAMRLQANALYAPLPDFAAATQPTMASKPAASRVAEDLTRKIALIQEQVAKLTDEELLDPRTTSRLQVLSTHASGNTPDMQTASGTHSVGRTTGTGMRDVDGYGDGDAYGDGHEDAYGQDMGDELNGDSRGWGIVLEGPVPELDMPQDGGWFEQQQQLLLHGQVQPMEGLYEPAPAEMHNSNSNQDDSGFLARLQASMEPPAVWGQPNHVLYHTHGVPVRQHLAAATAPVTGVSSSHSLLLPAVPFRRTQLGAFLAARAASGVPLLDVMTVPTQPMEAAMADVSPGQLYSTTTQRVEGMQHDAMGLPDPVLQPDAPPNRAVRSNTHFMLGSVAEERKHRAVVEAVNAISDVALQKYTGDRSVPSGPISSGDPMLLPPPPPGAAMLSGQHAKPPLSAESLISTRSATMTAAYSNRQSSGVLPGAAQYSQLLMRSSSPHQSGVLPPGILGASGVPGTDQSPSEQAAAATSVGLTLQPRQAPAMEGADVMLEENVATPSEAAGPHDMFQTGSSYTLAGLCFRPGLDGIPRTPTHMSSVYPGGTRQGSAASDGSIPQQQQRSSLHARGSYLPSPFAPASAAQQAGVDGSARAEGSAMQASPVTASVEGLDINAKVAIADASAGTTAAATLGPPPRAGSSSSVSDTSTRFSITAALDRYKQQMDHKSSAASVLASVRAVSATIPSSAALGPAYQHSTQSANLTKASVTDSAAHSQADNQAAVELDASKDGAAMAADGRFKSPAEQLPVGVEPDTQQKPLSVHQPEPPSTNRHPPPSLPPPPTPLRDIPPNPFDAALRNRSQVSPLVVQPLPQATVSPRLRRSSSPVPDRRQNDASSTPTATAAEAMRAHAVSNAAAVTSMQAGAAAAAAASGKPQATEIGSSLHSQVSEGAVRVAVQPSSRRSAELPAGVPEEAGLLQPRGDATLRRRASSGLLRVHAMYANGMRAAAANGTILRPNSLSNTKMRAFGSMQTMTAGPYVYASGTSKTQQPGSPQAPVVRGALTPTADDGPSGNVTIAAPVSAQDELKAVTGPSAAGGNQARGAAMTSQTSMGSIGSSTSRLSRFNSLGLQDTAAIVAAAAGLSHTALLPQQQSSTAGSASMGNQPKRLSGPSASAQLPALSEGAGSRAAPSGVNRATASASAADWSDAWRQREDVESVADSGSAAGASGGSATGASAGLNWAQPHTSKAADAPPSLLLSQSVTSMRWSASSGRMSRASLQHDALPSPSVPSHILDSRSSEVQLLLTTLATLGYDTTNPHNRQRVRSLLTELPKQQPLQQQFIQSLEWGTHQTQMLSDASNLSRLFDSRAAYVPSYQMQKEHAANQMQSVLPYVAPAMSPGNVGGDRGVGGDSGVPTMVTDEFGMLVPVPVLGSPDRAHVRGMPDSLLGNSTDAEEVVPNMVTDESGMLVHVPQRGSVGRDITPAPGASHGAGVTRDEAFSGYFSSPRKALLGEDAAIDHVEGMAAQPSAVVATAATKSARSSIGADVPSKGSLALPPTPAAPPGRTTSSTIAWPADVSQSLTAAVGIDATTTAPSTSLRGDLRLRAVARTYETGNGKQAAAPPGGSMASLHAEPAPSSELSMSGGLAPALSGGSGSGAQLVPLQGNGLQLALVVLGGSLVLLNLVAMVAMLLMMRSMGHA